MAKKKNDYFEVFGRMVDCSLAAAKFLEGALQDFDPATLSPKMEELHSIEHQSDEERHEMMTKLAKEFVTPIDREDIILLASEIDDVTDKIEDVLIRIYMYGITEIRPEGLIFCDIIVRCCEALKTAIEELKNYKKSAMLHQCVVNVNSMEEEGDEYYIKAVRELYTTENDPIKVLAWSEIYDRLEECCDACEHVANMVESVVMKNS